MMIMLHIVIACMSLACSLIGLATASRRIMATSHALVVATVASGSVLMLVEPVSILHLCVSGLMYTALAGTLGLLGHLRMQRLEKQTNR